MRKIFVTFLVFTLSSMFINSSVFASEDGRSVAIEESGSQSTYKRTRGIATLPEVWIDSNLNSLSVQFDAAMTAAFTITIYDGNEVDVFQSTFISNGTLYEYMLPYLSSGEYTITIQNANNSYHGRFFI